MRPTSARGRRVRWTITNYCPRLRCGLHLESTVLAHLLQSILDLLRFLLLIRIEQRRVEQVGFFELQIDGQGSARIQKTI